MCVAKRHIDEAGADEEGEIPRRRWFDEEEINEEGSLWPEELISDEKNRRLLGISSDEEAPNEEPWSRREGYDGSPLLVCFHLRILLRDKSSN
jgi:hypothetical protein